MTIAIVPLVAATIGALVYALAGNAKLAEMGRLTFGAAMLVLIAVAAHYGVRL